MKFSSFDFSQNLVKMNKDRCIFNNIGPEAISKYCCHGNKNDKIAQITLFLNSLMKRSFLSRKFYPSSHEVHYFEASTASESFMHLPHSYAKLSTCVFLKIVEKKVFCPLKHRSSCIDQSLPVELHVS